MTDEKQHVATVDEIESLLPPHLREAGTTDPQYEFVWMVTEEPYPHIKDGSLIDTYNSLYAEFHLFTDPETGKEYPLTSEDWKPCDTE